MNRRLSNNKLKVAPGLVHIENLEHIKKDTVQPDKYEPKDDAVDGAEKSNKTKGKKSKLFQRVLHKINVIVADQLEAFATLGDQSFVFMDCQAAPVDTRKYFTPDDREVVISG
jgi:hypothetical protein